MVHGFSGRFGHGKGSLLLCGMALTIASIAPIGFAAAPAEKSPAKPTAAKAAAAAEESAAAVAEESAEDKDAPAGKGARTKAAKSQFTTGSNDVMIQFINDQIRAGWAENGIEPSPVADDAEWLRRVYLDVIGHIPPAEEMAAFLEDKAVDKRATVINKLLDDPAYVRHWTAIWTNLLIGRGDGDAQDGGPQRRAALQKYLREVFAKNRPWNEAVQELVSAEGDFRENGAVNFLLAHLNDGAVPATAITARLFLGLQVQCTQCHNHPFNDWKQNQFWEYNSIFKQARGEIRRKYDEKTGRMVFDSIELVKDPFEGPVYFERRNGLMQVAFPKYETSEIDPSGDTNRREEFAKLIVAGERTQVADAAVNRMWGHFFGYGFTKPVDDMGPHNPASHPELLEKLSTEFVKSKYDLKQLIRWICNSEAYNLTSRMGPKNEIDNPAAGERPKFSHLYVKSLTAEQLYDSLIIATQAHKSGRANWEQAEQQRRQWMQQFVIAFGTDENDESTTFNGTIPQALMMMNGELTKNAIGDQKGSYLVTVLMDKGNEQAKLRELYLSTLGRPPSAKELNASKTLIKRAKTPLEGYQDLFWALLNSNEFIINH